MAENQLKGKYHLRSLHEEIGLYDRKLAHLLKYDSFASEKERDVAAEKLNSKRRLLVRDARGLVEAGVEYQASELPRSLRTVEEVAEEPVIKLEEHVIATKELPPQERAELSPRNTPAYLRKEIAEYVEKRHRAQNHSTTKDI